LLHLHSVEVRGVEPVKKLLEYFDSVLEAAINLEIQISQLQGFSNLVDVPGLELNVRQRSTLAGHGLPSILRQSPFDNTARGNNQIVPAKDREYIEFLKASINTEVYDG
jgi:hypothetical protein